MKTNRIHLDLVALHFSTRCGAACTFCYFSDPLAERQEPTSFNNIKEILNKLANEEVKEVLFVGGDPVIHPSFIESLHYAKSLGLMVAVLSNSWAIRPQDKLEEAVFLIDSCEATILGSNEESHDLITQRKGSFKNLIANLQKVSSFGKKIGICTNATPQNLNEIYDIVNNLKSIYEIPIRSLMIQRIIPSGGATGEFKFGLNINDLEILMQQLDKIAIEYSIPILFEDPVPWCTVNKRYHKYLSRCEWGFTRGAINSSGLLNRCGADDLYRLGSIFEGNIQETWKNHPILQSFRSKEYLADECKTCELLNFCGGGCPLSCGTFKDHDLDQLYIQKVQQESLGIFSINAPTGEGFNKVITRYAFDGDLEKIVKLESEIFGNSVPLFKFPSIQSYFDRCPKAFRVVSRGKDLLGYSVIFPLNEYGKIDVEKNHRTTIMDIDINFLCERFGSFTKALYIEVIAVSSNSSNYASISLLRDLFNTLAEFKLPIFTCPITDVGLNLVERFGFEPLNNNTQSKVFVFHNNNQ